MNKKLKEEDFIHEGIQKNPTPFWIWLLVILLFIGFAWIGEMWFDSLKEKETKKEKPISF